MMKQQDFSKISDAVRVLHKYLGKPNFNICEPKHSQKAIVDILKHTGDKIAAEDEIEKFLRLMMDSCQIGSAKGAIVAEESILKKKTKAREKGTPKKISGWICYLKTCAKETDLSYSQCITNSRKDIEYKLKKDFWKKEALKGCPKGM